VVGLVGPLGAGKTVFVKGLAEGLGIDPARVASPTFVVAHEYEGAGGARLAHVDLYRVKSEDELLAAGFLDLLAPGTTVAVEWADRLPEALPADRLTVTLQRPDPEGDPTGRILSAIASGPESEAVLARFEAATGGAGAES